MEKKVVKVKCVDTVNGHYHLTEGKKYKLEDFDRRGYKVFNDDGIKKPYHKSLFEKLEYTAEEMFATPAGTEFNIKYSDGNISSEKVKTTLDGCIIWENGNPVEFSKKLVKTIFIKVDEIKPVSFMEVINSDEKCRVEHSKVDEILTNKEISFDDNIIAENFAKMKKNEYIDLDNIMLVLSRYIGDKYLRQVIKEGKWYLEE
ncbi:hypothetical protein [Clostridium sp. C2-6-12]|uniref:hypothetical protein n=1 Tax=Clostridium sp. C2-6-12 TaxID=2698832 RepID=UPI001370DA78|nr:hypothetical protein [Clostridium sp. C2-6-12]